MGTIGASLGSAYSFLMRIELGIPGYVLLENNFHDYNVWITAHGVIMIFFMVMPIMIGALGNMIVPIQLGSPDMVFPRLNNLSFWLVPFSLILCIISTLLKQGCGTGWTLYTPLSAWIGHSDSSVDLIIFSIHFAGLSSLVGGVNFIATIVTIRWTIERQIRLVTKLYSYLSLYYLVFSFTTSFMDNSAINIEYSLNKKLWSSIIPNDKVVPR